MTKKARLIPLVAMAIVISSMGVGSRVSAQTLAAPTSITSWAKDHTNAHGGLHAFVPGVAGIVTAINGTTLTITGTNGTSTASTTFSINTTNAKIFKGSASTAASLGDIQIGDTLRVRGSINGTSVAATSIFDGIFPEKDHQSKYYQGIRGTIAGVSGSNLTVKSKDGTTYTVDASIAKIIELEASTTASTTSQVTVDVTSIKVGDKVMVQGTVSGDTVSAKKIVDGNWIKDKSKKLLRRMGKRGL